MEDHKEGVDVLLVSAIEENDFKELIPEAGSLFASSGLTRPPSKSKPFSASDCVVSEFDCDMVSCNDQFSKQLLLSSCDNLHINMEEDANSAGHDHKVPSTILNCPLESVREDATEEVMDNRPKMNDFPLLLSDCGDSSYDGSLSECSSVMSSPCTSFTVQSDIRSEDLDRTDIWVSSLDLDEEDTTLFEEKEQNFDLFSRDFPSPSFNAMRSLRFGPSCSSPSASNRKEATSSDEPIFWPFERTSYNSPEFERFLSVSPRRSTLDVGFAEIRQLNPIMLRLHKNKLSAVRTNAESHQGKITLGAKGTKISTDKVQKAAAVPSRLSRRTKVPSKHPQLNSCERTRPPHLKISIPIKVTSPRLQVDKPLQELEASDFQNLAEKNIPIEKFIGLDEFDGHEGISEDAWNCHFLLCVSPL